MEVQRTHVEDLHIFISILSSPEATLDGVNRLDHAIQHAKDIGQTAISITDHGNMAGSWAFFNQCNKIGMKPIIGEEFYIAGTDRTVRAKDALGKAYYHMILLAKNNNGLHNLFKLSSRAYTEGQYYKPRIDDALLSEYSDDVIATSACLGSQTSQLIMRGEIKAAERIIHHYAAMFQDRFFVELQLHTTPEQQQVNSVLVGIAEKNNLPLVITGDAHYTHEHDKHFHEITLRMATDSDGEEGFSFGDIDCHLASHDHMKEKAALQGIPYEAISNTMHVASMVDSGSYFSDRKNRWPTYKSLPAGITSFQYLEAKAIVGLKQLMGFPIPSNYEERLKTELRTLKKMGLCDYMLIVAEYTNKAWEVGGLPGPGRGSVAGSLVAYALGITQLDPIKYDLLFSRFVNEGRAGKPIIF